MAALSDYLSEPVSPNLEIVDLRQLVGRELDPLLLEETVEWEQRLDWDFSRLADLVRQFTDMRALLGVALVDRGEVAGYGYSVLEEQRGLVGDLFIRQSWRDEESYLTLFRALVDGLIAIPQVRRIESQLMLIEHSVANAIQRQRSLKIYERLLMSHDCKNAPSLPHRLPDGRFRFEPWGDHHQEAAASVISLGYQGHIDSQINDQYRSLAGARRFLYNIVQYPGCGTFFKPGLFVAFDVRTGWISGISLVSFVGEATGHITQLCVTPPSHGIGLGYELLRQSIAALRLYGAKRISLTVTNENIDAIRLYERCGFREMRRFFAYVWETS